MSEDSGQPQPPTDPQAPPYPAQQQSQPYPAQPYPAQPYPAQPYPAQPYPANPYGGPTAPYPPSPGQPGWGAQPGMPQFPLYLPPDLPKATAALVFGILSVAGTFVCILPVLAAPVAWILGVQARREIRNAPQQWGGESRATAGMVLGIIGTVLLVVLILAVIVLIAIAANDSTAFDSTTGV